MYVPLSETINGSSLTLEELNIKAVQTLVPAIVYTCVLMVCGVLGNALVIYVYCYRFKASNHRYFILTLGVCDFITSVVGMPFLIADELHPFTFTSVVACKSFRYISYNTALVSIFTLFLIAVDRYRKICIPFEKQITLPLARRILFAIVLLTATFFALPSAILYGHTTVYTGYRNISGVACFFDDSFRDNPFLIAYNMILFATVIFLGVVMVYIYGKIAYKRLLRVRARQKRKKLFDADSDNFLSSDVNGFNVHTSVLERLIQEHKGEAKEENTHEHVTSIKPQRGITKTYFISKKTHITNTNAVFNQVNCNGIRSSKDHLLNIEQNGITAKTSLELSTKDHDFESRLFNRFQNSNNLGFSGNEDTHVLRETEDEQFQHVIDPAPIRNTLKRSFSLYDLYNCSEVHDKL